MTTQTARTARVFHRDQLTGPDCGPADECVGCGLIAPDGKHDGTCEVAAEEAAALTADDVRDALAFNADDRDPVLATLRDVLLDTTATRTPAQALAAARIILTAHARQVAALVEAEHNATHGRWGLNRSTRGLLTGYSNARRSIRTYADRLADEQALAEGAEREQATP